MALGPLSCLLAEDLMLEHPLFNAAGTCKLLHQVKLLAPAATAAVMVGSITVEAREGNEGNVYWPGPGYTLNSLGLPNPGRLYYRTYLPEMAEIAHGAGKWLFVSVAGCAPVEYAALTEIAFACGADFVELNAGCPNVWEGREQKPILSFAPDLLAHTLTYVTAAVGPQAAVGVKLSPFSDPHALEAVALLLGRFAVVKAVTATNTFANAYAVDAKGKPQIDVGVGLAGLSGPALKPIALGQVAQLRVLLPPRVGVIGVGGITSGQDMLDYWRTGAAAMQVATAYLQRGERVFSELLAEFVEATAKKGEE